jgi:hypothetical protein
MAALAVNPCGADAPNASFGTEEAERYRARYAAGGVTIRALAREAGCSYSAMQKLISREHYPGIGYLTTRVINRHTDNGTAI